ncbi:MAG: hypothetical protein HQ589_02290 [Syntrophaceae bacterium]|nr:hypothetical protein [Syntrophaceae bacterium]
MTATYDGMWMPVIMEGMRRGRHMIIPITRAKDIETAKGRFGFMKSA